jgi:type IV pilus assembly protein PilM
MLLDRLKSLIEDPPPALAVEISEAGIAAARIGAKTELEFVPLKSGTLVVSPVEPNVADPDDFARAVRLLGRSQPGRKRRDLAVILPDYSTRTAVLDFDSFPSDAKEQISLLKFRLRRSVPFDVDAAAISYWPQVGPQKKVDVVVVLAPHEVVAQYEAPFRAAGLQPGLITTSSLAALELAQDDGLSVVAKMAGRVLTVLVRDKGTLKLVRCVELALGDLEDVAGVLVPTFVYLEDNLGSKAEGLLLCGFGARTDEAQRRFTEELGAAVETVRSPLGVPGETNAGLLGYLRSIARNN